MKKIKNEKKTNSVKAKAPIVKKTKTITDDKKTIATTDTKITPIIKKTNDLKKAALYLKLISFYYILSGVLTSVLGIVVASIPSKIKEIVLYNFPKFASFDPSIILNAVIFTGIFFILFGVFSVILGNYLSKSKQWARYVVIIFSLFSFSYAILNIINGFFTSIFGLILNGFIAWYLIFNKDLKKVIK